MTCKHVNFHNTQHTARKKDHLRVQTRRYQKPASSDYLFKLLLFLDDDAYLIDKNTLENLEMLLTTGEVVGDTKQALSQYGQLDDGKLQFKMLQDAKEIAQLRSLW